MNYDLFKDVVMEKILGYMSMDYRSCKVEFHSISKVNQTLDGLNIVSTEERDLKMTPTIYINDMYEHYKKCNDLDKVLGDAAGSIEKALEQLPNLPDIRDFNKAKDNIIMQLINTEQNKKMLENLPHREIKDLSIIYRWSMDINEEGIASTMINSDLAKMLGMNEEELFLMAMTNTKRLLPPTVRPMKEVINDILRNNGMPEDNADMIIGDMAEDKDMYVISNERGINGAVSMLYEEVLQQLAGKLNSNLYILPSSIHEVIAISANMGEPNELANMVTEINTEQVSLDERLSNQVYHYDKDLRKISLATDTPYKRLDGIVTDMDLIRNTQNQSGQSEEI
jgi:hypothetical protein